MYLDAVWLAEYTLTNNPKDAKRNNNQNGIRVIEEAYEQVNKTMALDSDTKDRIFDWMQQFRRE